VDLAAAATAVAAVVTGKFRSHWTKPY
jgi:hypothetical protein